jgi:hypothetical protein
MIQLNSIVKFQYRVTESVGEYVKVYVNGQNLIAGGRIVEKGVDYINVLIKDIEKPFNNLTFFEPIKKKVIRKII